LLPGVESGDEKNIHFVTTLKIKLDLAKNCQLAKIHQEIEPLLAPSSPSLVGRDYALQFS
jgi:hypothetical protein